MSRDKPWGGRFRESTDPAVERFTASIDFDRELARHDIRGRSRTRACSVARAWCAGGLRRHRRWIGSDPRRGGGGHAVSRPASRRHPYERRDATAASGSARWPDGFTRAAAAMTRSRRTWRSILREAARMIRHGLLELRRVLVARRPRARRHVLPAIRLAAERSRCDSRTTGWRSSKCSAATRSASATCGAAFARCPLGSGALAGARLPLDREPDTARALGFERTVSQQHGRGRLARCSARVPRRRGDRDGEPVAGWPRSWCFWSTAEFGFIELVGTPTAQAPA